MAEAADTPLSELLRLGRALIAPAGMDDPGLECRILVQHFAGADRLTAVVDPQRVIPAATVSVLLEAFERRARGEPVYRIIGQREFHGLMLRLSPATLEPRPDTETLVEAMLPLLRDVVLRRGACRILDLGTGTGAIALALLAQVEGATALGVDLAPEAVETARRNAVENGLGARFDAMVSDWFASVSGRFDVIVSNPPYIRSGAIAGLDVEVRAHDPLLALDGGADGLDAYRRIAAGCLDHLAPDGRVGVEIGWDQKAEVAAIFEAAGLRVVEAVQDLAGRDRVLIFQADDTI